jgi:uncharacterized protein YjbJ (UPF0337 family)
MLFVVFIEQTTHASTCQSAQRPGTTQVWAARRSGTTLQRLVKAVPTAALVHGWQFCPGGSALLIKQKLAIRRKQMKLSTKDEIKGTLHEVKGKVKEKAGQIVNDPDLEAKGKAERNTGKVEKKVGQIKKVLGE